MSSIVYTEFVYFSLTNSIISLAYLTLFMPQPTNVTPSTSSPLPTFIRGRNVNSVHIIHLRYCYGKDKTPTTDGRQAWRCVKRSIKCPGRLHTLVSTNAVVGEVKDHIHPANFIDSEVLHLLHCSISLKVKTSRGPSTEFDKGKVTLPLHPRPWKKLSSMHLL